MQKLKIIPLPLLTIALFSLGGCQALQQPFILDAPSALQYTGNTFSLNTGKAIGLIAPLGVIYGAKTCTATPALPAGLVLNNENCVISGTPTALSTATNYTITAANRYGSSSGTLSLEVIGITYGATSYNYTAGFALATINATTSGTISSCAINPALVAGLTLDTNTCAISGMLSSPQAAATYTIGGAATYALGGWVSGLQAGNLVLNNGGDTLTITGNGPFVFATPLAAAAAFAATIQSKTTTQTCRINIDDTASETGVGNMLAANFLSIAVVCDGDLVPSPTYVYTGPTNHVTYAGNYATTDLTTGRVRKTCVEGVSGATCFPALPTLSTWYPAGLACRALNDANTGAGYAGRKDWRLPTLAELQSIV